MTQEQPKPGEIVAKEGRKRKLAYTPEFKSAMPQGAIKFFLKLKEKIDSGEQEIAREGEFTVESLNFKNFSTATYYKVSYGSNAYFVKEVPVSNAYKGGGFGEAMSSRMATRILRKNGIDWAEVVDFKLGYENGRHRYFVSRWDERLSTTLYDTMRELLNTNPIKAEELKQKFLTLRGVLDDFFWDVHMINMAYDPVSGKIIIFDIFEKKYPH